jgi:hypothetical protein
MKVGDLVKCCYRPEKLGIIVEMLGNKHTMRKNIVLVFWCYGNIEYSNIQILEVISQNV